MLSQVLPVWVWIQDSSGIVMQISHSESLAIKHSHASKILIESDWFKDRFPEIKIRIDTHAKGNYMTTNGGKRISFGVTSGILGEGFNYLQIVDDINSPSDSQAVTQSINEIYANTLYSRISDFNATRIILQQRVASNDICGYLLETNPNKYLHVCLPVRVAPNISPPDAIDLYNNGLLWEQRFSNKVIMDFQATLGSRNFSQQMMQTAVASEGNIIKRAWIQSITLNDFNKLTNNQKNIDWNLYIDTAYTSKQTNDATAVILAGRFNNNVYVKKAWKYWLEMPELVKILQKTIIDYNVRITYIESKASGLSTKQLLQRMGFNVSDLTPKKINQRDMDKTSRVHAVTPRMEGGHFWLIEDSWNEMLISELTGFPYGHDDITDVCVYSIDNLINNSGINYAIL